MKDNFDNNNLENFFRESLDNMDTLPSADNWDLPSDQVWERIAEKSVATPAKTFTINKFYLRWVAAAAVIFAAVLIYELSNYREKIDELTAQVNETNEELEDVKKELANKESQNQQLAHEEMAIGATIENEKSPKNKNVLSKKQKEIVTSQNKPIASVTPSIPVIVNSNKTLVNNTNKIINHSPIIKNNTTDQHVVSNTIFQEKNILSKTNSSYFHAFEYKIEFNRTIQKNEFKNAGLLAANNINRQTNWNLQPLENATPMLSSSHRAINELPIPNVALDPEDLGIKRPRFSIRAMTTPTLTYRDIKGNASRPLKEVLDKEESAKFTVSHGLGFAIHPSDKWSIETGVSYNQSSLDFKHKARIPYHVDGEELNTDGYYESHYNYYMPTSYGEVETDIVLERSATSPIEDNEMVPLDINANHDFKFLTIPVVAKYRIGKKPLQLTLRAGVQAKVLLDNKLDVEFVNARIDEVVSTETVAVRKNKNLKKLTTEYLVGAGVEYHLNKDLAIFVEPTYTKSISPLFEKSGIKTYPTTASVNMGLNYNF